MPRVYSMLTGCSPHDTQGFIPHFQGLLCAHRANPMLLGNHPMCPVSPHITQTLPCVPRGSVDIPTVTPFSPGVTP